MYSLAKDLHKTVAEIKRDMTASELYGWVAYYKELNGEKNG